MWFYFDANALAKRYSKEPGSDLVSEFFCRVALTQMACLTLSIVEIMSILVRKKNDGRLGMAAFNQAMTNFREEVIDAKAFAKAKIDDSLVMSALSFVAKHNINSTDAVILRSVLNMKTRLDEAGDKLVLLTSDKRLIKAAKNENVDIFDVEVETLTSLEELIDAGKRRS